MTDSQTVPVESSGALSASSRDDIERLLIAPILALQFPRDRSVTAKAYKDGLDMLRQSLRYLPLADLCVVADEAMVMARQFKRFPSPYIILDAAHRHRADPRHEMKINRAIESMMRSVAGKRAQAEDHAVEMLRAVCQRGHGWKVSDREHAIWESQAVEGRRAEKRRFRAEVADFEGAEIAACEAETDAADHPADAARAETAKRNRSNADALAPAAETARRRLTYWQDFETRAAEMTRASSPCEDVSGLNTSTPLTAANGGAATIESDEPTQTQDAQS